MESVSRLSRYKVFTLSALVLLTWSHLAAQQTPLNPTSYWVFTPYIYNPAMTGSKDFMSLDFNGAWQGKSDAQLLAFTTRLSKSKPGYFSSPKLKEFKGFGVGASVFNDVKGNSHNIGASAAGSYQISLSTKKLSFLSIGAAVKGVYNMLDTNSAETSGATENTIYPNVDAGIYYYGTNFFTGVSGINLMGNPGEADSLGIYAIPVSREYFFTAGYKFVLSKSRNYVIEPSFLFRAVDSTFNDTKELYKNIIPVLKLYIQNICFGASYTSRDENTSVFFEYRFPRIYLGGFCELPKKTAFYKKPPILEFTCGFNFQVDKSRFTRRSTW